jgi:hypothetical protein
MAEPAKSGISRTPITYLVLALILATFLHSRVVISRTQAPDKPHPFHPGEKLTYRAKWGVIPAGELTLEVLPLETVYGIRAYHFTMITKTNATVDRIYRVRERQDSYVDLGMTHSILYTKRSEGKHPRDVAVNFDCKKHEATRSTFGEKMAPVHIVPGAFDTLALFYVIRLHDLREGSVIEIPISEGDNNIVVNATVGKRETIEIEKKTYDTFAVIPDMEKLEKQQAVKKGDVPQLKIWFTADAKKLPVKIQSKVRIGYFVFELLSGLEP